MKVLFFGAYDRNFPRYRILIKGLLRNNIEVIECNDRSRLLPLRVARLVKKHKKVDYDIMLIGHVGQYLVPLTKVISQKPIIFDIFNSLYETWVIDRKLIKENTLRAYLMYYLDKYSFKYPLISLADTNQHKKFFSQFFKIDESKFRILYLGSDDDIFQPKTSQDTSFFHVMFVGSFIPLHGVPYIVKAAKILESYKEIKFTLIGAGQTYSMVRSLAQRLNLKNITFKPPIPYIQLPSYLSKANILLGIFGNTPKAKRVVPFKVFDALAMKKPIITGDSPAIREVLTNEKTALMCEMANPKQLANAILKLYEDNLLLKKIAKNGYDLYQKHFTTKAIGETLKNIFKEAMYM